MKIQKGAPTKYGYTLPLIRFNLSKKYLKKTQKMLDFGCGNGANTVLFNKSVQNIFAIDIENERINEAKIFIKTNNIHNIRYQLYDGKKIPFQNNLFDVIISFEVLEHTDDDKHTLKEMYRVLKKNGTLIISVPNKWYLMETHGFNLPLNKIIPYNRIPFLNLLPDSFYKKYGNARIYTINKIKEILNNSNFKVINQSYIKPPLDIINNKLLKKIINIFVNILPDFMGTSIFLVCKK